MLVVDFRDVDEKNEFRALVWNTSERRNATVGTQPYNKKGTTNDGTGHPSHKDAFHRNIRIIRGIINGNTNK